MACQSLSSRSAFRRGIQKRQFSKSCPWPRHQCRQLQCLDNINLSVLYLGRQQLRRAGLRQCNCSSPFFRWLRRSLYHRYLYAFLSFLYALLTNTYNLQLVTVSSPLSNKHGETGAMLSAQASACAQLPTPATRCRMPLCG